LIRRGQQQEECTVSDVFAGRLAKKLVWVRGKAANKCWDAVKQTGEMLLGLALVAFKKVSPQFPKTGMVPDGRRVSGHREIDGKRTTTPHQTTGVTHFELPLRGESLAA
jgi:hypothetical protein